MKAIVVFDLAFLGDSAYFASDGSAVLLGLLLGRVTALIGSVGFILDLRDPDF